MIIQATEIPDVKLITPTRHTDDRGYFFENIHMHSLRKQGLTLTIAQENISRSSQGTLRGLHYQLSPFEQGKLVQVTQGEVFDVAVDIRQGSPTYGQSVGRILSEHNRSLLYIPPGFAHGFYVLSETADFLYKCSSYYNKQSERTIRWDDKTIGINWPLVPNTTTLISEKDRNAPNLLEAENNFIFTNKKK